MLGMTLAEYLDRKQLTPGAFADLIGVTRTAVIRYRDGQRRPSWEILPKIVAATNGKVTADSFLSQARRAA
jgi:transcriptional regulator with XRE-family HTH domain